LAFLASQKTANAYVQAQKVAADRTDRREDTERERQRASVNREIRGYLLRALAYAAILVEDQTGDSRAKATWSFGELLERSVKSDIAASVSDEQQTELNRMQTTISLALRSISGAEFGGDADLPGAGNTLVIGLNSGIAIANALYKLDPSEEWFPEDLRNGTLVGMKAWDNRYLGKVRYSATDTTSSTESA
jgi:hypothetical protein